MNDRRIIRSSTADPVDNLLNRILREANKMEEKVQYANFVERSIARIIDTAIILGIAYGIELLAKSFIINDNPNNVDIVLKGIHQAVPALALMIWVLLYSPIMEATGGSVGKRIMKIELIDEKELETPVFRNCMARTWIYLVFVVLAIAPAILTCLGMFLSDKKQTWHDKITGMVCIKKK